MLTEKVRKAATAGVLSAVVLVLGITNLDFIPLPIASVTILHIPVIIGAILEGPLVGIFIGLLFGVFSIIKASMIGVTPVDLAALSFPYIAIIPRLLIPLAAWGFYKAISMFKKAPAAIAIVVGAVAGSFANTFFYLAGIVLVLEEITFPMIVPVIAFNGTLEAAAAALISLAVISAWKHIPTRGGKSKLTSN
jgi:uncharacterized membrane protein